MADHAVRPVAVNGLTTATNATVSSTAAGIALTGTGSLLTVGAEPIYIMWGGPNVAATLTSTTGFRLPAGFCGRMSHPMQATHIYHLRASGTDSTLSVLGMDGGT